MPTKKSQGMLRLIRSHKKFANAVGNQLMMKIDPSADIVAKIRMNGTTAVSVHDLQMPALLISPRKVEVEDAVILHMHGGAYVSGGIMQSRALISPLCDAAGVRTLTFSYHLAPRYPYPAQLEDACRVYCFLRSAGYPAHKIALVGESAGGNLALELALKLRDEGQDMPCAIALMSPWADLSQSGGSYKALAKADATLDAESLLESAVAFAGSASRLKDAHLSPAYADFTGFPPVMIHCGTQEILLSDSEMLEMAMLRDGVDVQLIRWEGMCHVFQAFGFEESKASVHQLGMFLKQKLKEG